MALSNILEELQIHLSEVALEPHKPLQPRVLDRIDSLAISMHIQTGLPLSYLCLLDSFSDAEKDALITQLAELLPRLQQDPTPITHMVEKLISPATFTFSRVLAIRPTIDFVAGLSAPVPSINLITLSLLKKASLVKSDSDIVAGRPSVVAALVRLWLCTTDTEVAHRSHQTLTQLLMVGRESASTRSLFDENLMWRRLFRDRDIYGSIFALCSLKTLGLDGQLSKSGKTTAQGRLLDLLLLIDSEPVRRSQFPDIESSYGVTDADEGGLLTFATVHMIDFTNDPIMHVILINFCTEFLRSPSPMSDSSKAIDFLVKAGGLHSRIISYYTNPAPIDTLHPDFVYAPAAFYVSAYAQYCPSHLLGDSSVLESILKRLSMLFNVPSPPAQPPDFTVLETLPKAALQTEPQLEMIAQSIREVDEELGETAASAAGRPAMQGQIMALRR